MRILCSVVDFLSKLEAIIEVNGNGDDGILDGCSEVALGGLLHLGQDLFECLDDIKH